MHRTLVRNSVFNVFRYGIRFGIIMLLTPYIVGKVGDSQFGLWEVLFAVIGYAGLLDAGIQHAVVKLVAQYKQTDVTQLNKVSSTVVIVFSGVGVLAGIGAYFFLGWYVPGQLVAGETLNNMDLFIRLISLNVVFTFVVNSAGGVLLGLHQFHLRAVIDIVVGLFRLVATYFVLERGMGLMGLAVVKNCMDAIDVTCVFIGCKYAFSALKFRFRFFDLTALKEVLSFGGKLFISVAVSRLNRSSVPIFITSVLSTVFNAYFTVGNMLVNAVKQVMISLTAGFLPMFSELNAKKDESGIQTIYIMYTKYINMVIVPLFIGLAIVGGDFIRLWVSDVYAHELRFVIVLLAMDGLILNMQPLAERMLLGKGMLRVYVSIGVATNLVVLALSWPVIYYWSLEGIAATILVVNVIAQIFLFRYVYTILRLDLWSTVYGVYLKCMFLGGVLAGLLVLFRNFYPIGHYYDFLKVCIIPTCVYFVLAYLYVLTSDEKKYIRVKLLP